MSDPTAAVAEPVADVRDPMPRLTALFVEPDPP